MNELIEIIIISVALYGVTTLVAEYEGVFGVFAKLRSAITFLQCVPCSAVWIGIPLAFVSGIGLIGYLASIGFVLLLDRMAGL